MLGVQRPAKCKFGVGFTVGDAPQSNIKLKQTKSISFVKSTCLDTLTENKELTSNEGSQSLKTLYVQPIISQTTWLKPKNRAVGCSGKVKTERKPKTFYKHKVVLKLKEVSRVKTAETKIFNGKSVKVIQAWIPKGLIYRAPT